MDNTHSLEWLHMINNVNLAVQCDYFINIHHMKLTKLKLEVVVFQASDNDGDANKTRGNFPCTGEVGSLHTP